MPSELPSSGLLRPYNSSDPRNWALMVTPQPLWHPYRELSEDIRNKICTEKIKQWRSGLMIDTPPSLPDSTEFRRYATSLRATPAGQRQARQACRRAFRHVTIELSGHPNIDNALSNISNFYHLEKLELKYVQKLTVSVELPGRFRSVLPWGVFEKRKMRNLKDLEIYIAASQSDNVKQLVYFAQLLQFIRREPRYENLTIHLYVWRSHTKFWCRFHSEQHECNPLFSAGNDLLIDTDDDDDEDAGEDDVPSACGFIKVDVNAILDFLQTLTCTSGHGLACPDIGKRVQEVHDRDSRPWMPYSLVFMLRRMPMFMNQ